MTEAHTKAALKGDNRFEEDASRYAAYVDSPEGRLRADLTFNNLQEFLPVASGARTLTALDVGCGTGTAAVRLARLGWEVTLLDSSPTMLELAQSSLVAAGFERKTKILCSDGARLGEIFSARSFDLVLCHNVLEYVGDPFAVLQSTARVMRNSSAVLSILVRNQVGEAVKAALQTGDLLRAEENLVAEWAQESLYGGKVRLFTPERLEATLAGARFSIVARRGVRVIADYLPSQIARSAEYERIFALERKLGHRAECFGMARYIHFIARHASAHREMP